MRHCGTHVMEQSKHSPPAQSTAKLTVHLCAWGVSNACNADGLLRAHPLRLGGTFSH